MTIRMMIPATRIDEAMELATKARSVSCFEEAEQFAEELGGYTDYAGACGDAAHIGDYIGGAITGYICEKAELEELDGEQIAISVEGMYKEVV